MKYKSFFLPILSFLTLSSIISGQEKVSVKVFPEIYRQKIESIGGNYCQARFSNSAWDDIGGETLKQFRPGCVRMALPMRFRKTEYNDYKGAKIVEQPLVISLLETMKRMKYEFGVKSFTVSVWDVPDELVKDPDMRNQRIIKPESYDEILDMLVAFLSKAKSDYGVEVDNFSFNESDGGWQIQFSPQEYIAFIKKATPRFEAAGLKTKFLLADTAQTLGTVEFASMIIGDSSIWKMLGPLSFHCWWSENIPDSEFERVAALGKALNKPVWCCELGFDAEAHKIPGMFETWDYALRFAKISHRMFKYAEVEVSMYWTWQNDYAIMSSDLKTLYPSYYITRHIVDYLNTGTQIVHSLSSDADILSLSGIRDDGTQILQLINLKKVPVQVEVDGYTSKSIDMITTSESNNWLIQKNICTSEDSHTSIQILPESVNTIILK
jgi:hypothetical protein